MTYSQNEAWGYFQTAKILVFSVFWKVHKLLPEAVIILVNDTQLSHHCPPTDSLRCYPHIDNNLGSKLYKVEFSFLNLHLKRYFILKIWIGPRTLDCLLFCSTQRIRIAKKNLLTALSSSVNNVVCWLINILVEILDVYNRSRKYWTFSIYFGCFWWYPFLESLITLFFISITASAIKITVLVCRSRTRIKASANSRRTLGSLGLDFSKAKTSRKLWA